jgi:hypothetical protein
MKVDDIKVQENNGCRTTENIYSFSQSKCAYTIEGIRKNSWKETRPCCQS